MQSIPGAGPAFFGYIDTTIDALRIVQAAVDGSIPRTTRRLNATERKNLVKSGAVFVFSVIESGIKRWTDGMAWTPSRIRGNFLLYKQMEKMPTDSVSLQGQQHDTNKSSASGQAVFEVGALLKKTISVTLRGLDFHLVSYYKLEDVGTARLSTPRSRPDLMSLNLSPGNFRLDKLRTPPRTEEGPNGECFVLDGVEEGTPTTEQTAALAATSSSVGGASPERRQQSEEQSAGIGSSGSLDSSPGMFDNPLTAGGSVSGIVQGSDNILLSEAAIHGDSADDTVAPSH